MNFELDYLREEYFSALHEIRELKKDTSRSSDEILREIVPDEVDLFLDSERNGLLKREVLEVDDLMRKSFDLKDDVGWVIAILKRVPFKGYSALLERYLLNRSPFAYLAVNESFITYSIECIPFHGKRHEEGHMVMLSAHDIRNLEKKSKNCAMHSRSLSKNSIKRFGV